MPPRARVGSIGAFGGFLARQVFRAAGHGVSASDGAVVDTTWSLHALGVFAAA